MPTVAYMTSTSTRRVHGPAVRAIRQALGVKHGEFAIRCGITPGYLTNIEAARKQPSATVAQELAKNLGVPLDAIAYPVDLAA